MLGKERSEDKRDNSGELDEDVKGRSGSIFKRVSDGISNNSGFVGSGTLGEVFVAFFNFFIGESSVISGYFEVAGFDVFLGIIPGSSGIGGSNGHLDTGDDDSCKVTSDSLGTEEDTEDEGGEDDHKSRDDHFSKGSLGGNGDAFCGVSVVFSDLFLNLFALKNKKIIYES